MEERSKFVVRMSLKTLMSIGIVTPIHLISFGGHMAFYGLIIDQHLKRILKKYNTLILVAVKMTLGKSFLEDEKSYKVDIDITSQFLASILEIRLGKMEVEALLEKIFYVDLLVGLEATLYSASPRMGIPQAARFVIALCVRRGNKILPFRVGLEGMALVTHMELMAVGLDYLVWVLKLPPSQYSHWVLDFRAFSRRMASWRQTCLVKSFVWLRNIFGLF